MTTPDATIVLREELAHIAPDIDFASVNRHGDLREEFDIDSMDFLNLITALHERLGIDIAESEYRELSTVADAITFLERRLKA